MVARSAVSGQPRAERARMYSSAMQGFVGIDIAHAAQEALVEQQWLDHRVPAAAVLVVLQKTEHLVVDLDWQVEGDLFDLLLDRAF